MFSESHPARTYVRTASRHYTVHRRRTANLVVVEDGVEAEPVAVEEVFVAQRVVVSSAPDRVAKQRVGKLVERLQARLHAQAADVDDDALGPRRRHGVDERRRQRQRSRRRTRYRRSAVVVRRRGGSGGAGGGQRHRTRVRSCSSGDAAAAVAVVGAVGVDAVSDQLEGPETKSNTDERDKAWKSVFFNEFEFIGVFSR